MDSIAAMALDRKPLPWDLRIGLVGSTLRHYLAILLYPIGLTPKVPRPVRVMRAWPASAPTRNTV